MKALLPALALLSACTRVDSVSAPVSPPPPSAVAFVGRIANLTGSTPGAVPAPPGLKACFAGEANANDVVSNNAGVLRGATSYSASGRFGQAFAFGALGDGIVVPANASLNVGPGAGITMAAWIRADGQMFSAGSYAGAGPIMEFDNGAHLWHHSQQGSNEALFTNMAPGTDPSQWQIVTAQQGLPYGSGWRHTAASYSRQTGWIRLYIDGVPKDSALVGSIFPYTAGLLRIGMRAVEFTGGADFTFNGAIDEVQLYDRALTAAEVVQLASASGTMCVPPPTSFQVTRMPVGSGESGVPFTTQPTVAILDAAGNIVSNATTQVSATGSGAGTLTGTTSVNAVSGIATFTNLAVNGVGSTTITFTTATPGLTAVGTTTSPPLATTQVARQLVVTTQPGGAASRTLLSPQPTVRVFDAAGLPMAGVPVTVAIGSGTGTLSGLTTVISSATGFAAFTNLSVSGGGPVSLAFTTNVVGVAVTSDAFTVTPGLVRLRLASTLTGAETGMPFSVSVEAIDDFGVRATAATGTVSVTMTGTTGGVLVGTPTAAMVNGLATFSGLQVNTAGSFVLNFTSSPMVAVSTASFAVVQQVRQLVILTAPTVLANGLPMNPPFSVELRDAAGLKVLGATNQVTASIATGTGTLSGATVSAVAGVATFTNLTVTGTGSITLGFALTIGAVASVTSNAYSITNVLFAWGGFLEPIKNLPAVNKSEAGQSIPIQFTLGSDKGLDILAVGFPASQSASCTTFATTGAATPITTGDADNKLKFSGGGSGKYQIKWETDKSWQNTCRVLIVKLTDGTTHTANFEFKK